MNWAAFVFTTIPLLIQRYAERFEEVDNAATLAELEDQSGVPRIKCYDYIIVGGGTAGSLLAGRLSEKHSVLLIEAGGNPVPMSQTPFYTNQVSLDPATNYLFRSVPQANAALQTGGVVSWYLGKMLGGSGSHNEMIYMRGNPQDWNGLARRTKDDGYNYSNIIKVFKRTESFRGRLVNEREAGAFGSEGPLVVESEFQKAASLWFAAGKELGYVTADPNGRSQSESFSPMHKMMLRGRRVSTFNAYVKPVEGRRERLSVHRYSYANEVLIDGRKKAYGVAYTRHGIPQVAHANREVIVSCGTFSSPLLLMRSGIGPQDVLREAGIQLKVKAPRVGRNLADHVFVVIDGIRLNSSAESYMSRVSNENFEGMLREWEEVGTGLLGELTVGPQALLVSPRGKAAGEAEWPDSRVTLFTRCTPPFGEAGRSVEWCLLVTLDRPASRGSLRLNATEFRKGSQDDTKLAVIDPNTFGDPSDVDVLVDAIEVGLRVFEETKSFGRLGAVYAKGPVDGCSEHVFRSRGYWRCYVRRLSGPGAHMTGTCSIGSVVDNELKVKGVRSLRVVDGSVFPLIPNANLNGPVIAIAEKTASLILTSK